MILIHLLSSIYIWNGIIAKVLLLLLNKRALLVGHYGGFWIISFMAIQVLNRLAYLAFKHSKADLTCFSYHVSLDSPPKPKKESLSSPQEAVFQNLVGRVQNPLKWRR